MKQPVVTEKFNQSEAVQRCRAVTEAKLKGSYALTKLADEEVTMLSANLEENRQQLRTQLFEQRAQDTRQDTEAADFRKNNERKQQLSDLVDRLGIMKKFLRFQEESRERDIAFKGIIRNKRIAFRVRMARLEQRQSSERNELIMAQRRLIDTTVRIQAIELAALKDTSKANQKRKENESFVHQSRMRQQKEAEFLRELQLRKARQLAEINEIEISNSEELEELQAQHKLEEFEILAKQARAEAELHNSVEKQRSIIESSHLLEKQKIARSQMQRAQRKQANSLLKAQKSAIRARERMMIAENPVIRGDANTSTEVEDNFSDQQSTASRTQSSTGLSEASSTFNEEQDMSNEAGGANTEEENDDVTREAVANALANRDTPSQVISEEQRELNALADQARERLRSMLAHHKNVLNELRSVHKHQISLKMKEHRRKISDAIKEHEDEIDAVKQDQIQLMEDLIASQGVATDKESAESVNNLMSMSLPAHVVADLNAGRTPGAGTFKEITVFCIDVPSLTSIAEQLPPAALMDVISTITTRIDTIVARADALFRLETAPGTWIVATGLNHADATATAAAATAGRLLAGAAGAPVPLGGVAARLAAPTRPDGAVRVSNTRLAFAGAATHLRGAGGGSLRGSSERVLAGSNEAVHDGDDGGGAAVGIDGDEDGSSSGGGGGGGEDARAQIELALHCVQQIMQLEFDDLACLDDVDERVLLRVGVATGNAVGGLIGAKMGKYCLLGDAVEKSVQLCRTAQPGTVNVGPETQKLMDGLF